MENIQLNLCLLLKYTGRIVLCVAGVGCHAHVAMVQRFTEPPVHPFRDPEMHADAHSQPVPHHTTTAVSPRQTGASGEAFSKQAGSWKERRFNVPWVRLFFPTNQPSFSRPPPPSRVLCAMGCLPIVQAHPPD